MKKQQFQSRELLQRWLQLLELLLIIITRMVVRHQGVEGVEATEAIGARKDKLKPRLMLPLLTLFKGCL
jgi:hypothetical protein